MDLLIAVDPKELLARARAHFHFGIHSRGPAGGLSASFCEIGCKYLSRPINGAVVVLGLFEV